MTYRKAYVAGPMTTDSRGCLIPFAGRPRRLANLSDQTDSPVTAGLVINRRGADDRWYVRVGKCEANHSDECLASGVEMEEDYINEGVSCLVCFPCWRLVPNAHAER